MSEKPDTPINDARFVTILWGIVLLVGLSFLGYEGIGWLRDGVWVSIPIGRYVPKPTTIDWANWRGIEKIIDGVLSLDIGGVFFLLGVIFFARAQDKLRQLKKV
jgi:hypothetical protein